MTSFPETDAYLESVFGTDYAYEAAQKGVSETDLIANVKRKSDGSMLGYVAAVSDQGENEDGSPGIPFLRIQVYFLMNVAKDYLAPMGRAL